MQGPGRLVLAAGRQPNPKVVALIAPIQLVVPVTCSSSYLHISLQLVSDGAVTKVECIVNIMESVVNITESDVNIMEPLQDNASLILPSKHSAC